MPNVPAGATAPQDHQKKNGAPKFEKVEIDLPVLDEAGAPVLDDDNKPLTRQAPARRAVISGIEVTVADEALDDFELLDDFRGLGDSDASRLPSVLRRMVGDDYKRILNELRDPATRRVSAAAGSQFVFDVVQAFNPNS